MDSPEEPFTNDEDAIKRREALAKIGRFAAYTAPVVLGMLSASKAVAATTPGGGCCWTDALLASGQKVGEAQQGAPLLMMEADGSRVYDGYVERARPSLQPCIHFRTESGIGLSLSQSTPVPVRRDGAVDYLTARDVLPGDVIPVQDAAGFRWESLDVIEERGILPVSLLSAQNGVYAAGDDVGRFIFTHNVRVKA